MKEPALTPDEWKPAIGFAAWCGSDCSDGERIQAGGTQRWASGIVTFNNEYEIERPHACAALCLYDRPFGFDFVDRDRLREIAAEMEKRNLPEAWCDRLRDLADRIERLLPPADIADSGVLT